MRREAILLCIGFLFFLLYFFRVLTTDLRDLWGSLHQNFRQDAYSHYGDVWSLWWAESPGLSWCFSDFPISIDSKQGCEKCTFSRIS